MCIMCLEIQKGMKLTEVAKALTEFVVPQEHLEELAEAFQGKIFSFINPLLHYNGKRCKIVAVWPNTEKFSVLFEDGTKMMAYLSELEEIL